MPPALAFALSPAFALLVLTVTGILTCVALGMVTVTGVWTTAKPLHLPAPILIEIDGTAQVDRLAARAHPARAARVTVPRRPASVPPAPRAPRLALVPPPAPAPSAEPPPRARSITAPAPRVVPPPVTEPVTHAVPPSTSGPAAGTARPDEHAARTATPAASRPTPKPTIDVAAPVAAIEPPPAQPVAHAPAPAPVPHVSLVGRIQAPGPAGARDSHARRTVYLVDLDTWQTVQAQVDDQGSFVFHSLRTTGQYCIVAWFHARVVHNVRHDGTMPVKEVTQARYSWHQALHPASGGTYAIRLDEWNCDPQYRPDLVPVSTPFNGNPHDSWRRAELVPVGGQG